MLMLARGVDVEGFRLVAAVTDARPESSGIVHVAAGCVSRNVSGSWPMTSITPSPSRSAHPIWRRVAPHIASPLAIITQAAAAGLQLSQLVLSPSR